MARPAKFHKKKMKINYTFSIFRINFNSLVHLTLIELFHLDDIKTAGMRFTSCSNNHKWRSIFWYVYHWWKVGLCIVRCWVWHQDHTRSTWYEKDLPSNSCCTVWLPKEKKRKSIRIYPNLFKFSLRNWFPNQNSNHFKKTIKTTSICCKSIWIDYPHKTFGFRFGIYTALYELCRILICMICKATSLDRLQIIAGTKIAEKKFTK